MSQSKWEALLAQQIQAVGLPKPEREFKFMATRRFKFDFAFPKERVACEVEGGIWTRGRHTRGKGFESDCQKYSLAAVEGWAVIRATPEMVRTGEAIRLLEAALKARRAKGHAFVGASFEVVGFGVPDGCMSCGEPSACHDR